MITEFQGEYRYLSNFWLAPFFYGNATWPSSEHAFQAFKTLDSEERYRVLLSPTPGAAKREGRKVTLRPDWDQIKKQVMLQVVLAKFIQNPDLVRQLAATGTVRLIEGNTWHDNYWGSCKCHGCNAGSDDWWGDHGKNYLGRTLMFVRDLLMAD
jgi:ribA/ribD-fused uncharacterized protein